MGVRSRLVTTGRTEQQQQPMNESWGRSLGAAADGGGADQQEQQPPVEEQTSSLRRRGRPATAGGGGAERQVPGKERTGWAGVWAMFRFHSENLGQSRQGNANIEKINDMWGHFLVDRLGKGD